jgi:multicomponent Na+:H+ antiporter subunit D
MIENILYQALLTPFICIFGVLAFGKYPNLREAIALLAAAFLAYNIVNLWSYADATQIYVIHHVFGKLQIAFHIEPLGLLFASIASFLWFITTIYAAGYMRGNEEHKQTRFFASFALAIFCAIGMAFAANLFTFFIFYEAMTLGTYALVVHHENEESRKSGRVYLGVLFFSSLLFQLPAIIWVYSLDGGNFTIGGVLENEDFTPMTALILLLLFAYGMGKAALMPMHKWLPAAMVAPTPVSAMLHAVAVVKAGVFGVTKIAIYIFGIDFLTHFSSHTGILTYLAGFSIIIASLIAMRQDNLKKRLAYSTISQLSYVTMAVSLFHPIAMLGAMLHILAHALGKVTLFFAAGSIYTASHKKYVSELDGIGRRMPITMIAFSIGALSMIGLPPMAGFVSKWYMISGALTTQHYFVLLVIITSTILNSLYFLPIIYRAFFKEFEGEEHGEAPKAILIAITTTATLCIAMFFLHDIFVELLDTVG